MSSPLRAAAARANGAKSKGPITPQGKNRSSLNSITHGLTARDACLATEDHAEYQRHRDLFFHQFKPSTPFLHHLTDTLAAIAWRLRRAESIETALLDLEIDTNADSIKQSFDTIDRQGLWAIGFKSICDSSNAFTNLDRNQARLFRQYMRVLNQIKMFANEPKQ